MGVPVGDFEFTLEQVTSLAQKLSKVQQDLQPEEYKLLLAIFAAAAARATVTNQAAHTSTLPEPHVVGQASGPIPQQSLNDLQDQLINAYIPGNYFQAVDPTKGRTTGDQNQRQ
jgi:hypothetical protein